VHSSEEHEELQYLRLIQKNHYQREQERGQNRHWHPLDLWRADEIYSS